jgi:hypothetical protein
MASPASSHTSLPMSSSDSANYGGLRPHIPTASEGYNAIQHFLDAPGPWTTAALTEQFCRCETGGEAPPEPSPGASCSPESSQSYAVESPVSFMAYCSEGSQVSLTSRRSRGSKKGGSQSQDGPPFLCPLLYNSRRTNVPAGCENVSVPTEAEAM